MGHLPDQCCCGSGCNGWWYDGLPSNGFEGNEIDGSTKDDCNRWDDCDGDGNFNDPVDCACKLIDGEPNLCCGPAVPAKITINSSVLWDFGWYRDALNLTCQADPSIVDPPSASYSCSGRNFTVWEPDTSWEWITGGSISNLELELSPFSDPQDGEMAQGCCAKYYYGSVAVDGPNAPGVADNPWGFSLPPEAYCGPQYVYEAPPKLRAYARLVMQFRGEGPNGVIPTVHPRMTLLTVLDIYIGLDGHGEGWSDFGKLSESEYTHPVNLYNFTSVYVDGCNCNGWGYIEPPAEVDGQDVVHILDTVDWSNNVKVTSGSQGYWHYAHEHADPDNTYTVEYGRAYEGGGTNVCSCGPAGRDPNCCPEEPTYTLSSYSGCESLVLTGCTGGCSFPQPWTLNAGYRDGNWSCASNGTKVWTTAERADFYYVGQLSTFQNQPIAANDDTSFNSVAIGCVDPCGSYGDTGQTHIVRGGFRGGIAPAQVFPNCGLRNFQITYPGYPGVESPTT